MAHARSTLYFLWLYFLFTLSCNVGQPKDETNIKNNICDVTATVLDYTGLDGCQYLLQLENGEILSPHFSKNEIFSPSNFFESKTVSISYRDAKELMSICMKGKMVEITCCTTIEKGRPVQPIE